MDIRVTSTEKTFFEVPSAIAALLLEAFPERFQKSAPRPHWQNEGRQAPVPPNKIQWGVGVGDSTGAVYISANLPRGEFQQFFGVVGSRGYASWCAYCGGEPPESILKLYEERKRRP